ncbi:MAG: homoserine dehydrogenase [Defluviitaleaceae bacterium]|nr:homoserine dehydrogenase [Defluviitaleaceae bacterium]
MNIAIIGAGAVAKTFIELLYSPDSTDTGDIKVKYVFNSTGGVYEAQGFKPFKNLGECGGFKPGLRIADIDINEIDLVIDLKSTDLQNAQKDFDTCTWVLKKGLHLVSGNKGPVVYGYNRLKALADTNNVRFLCGCAAAAALPSVLVGVDAHAGSKVTAFEGIVNGTTNYIISKMEAGVPYKAALKLAQEAGIAEKNPDYDVKGIDTAIKTVMLANILWGTEMTVEDADITGIDKLTIEDVEAAAKKGEKIKLIGKAVPDGRGRAKISVCPTSVDSTHLLYGTDEKYKAIVFSSGNLGNILISGASSLKGAAAAVLRDVANIARLA